MNYLEVAFVGPIGQLSKKIVAIAFIVLIVLGNIWLMSMFTHEQPPAWTATAFIACIVFVGIGAIGLGVDYLISPKSDS